ncbi:MAG: N-6 DNA methylase, partial [Clostridiales bacterium]|nr:N-6 DNA methylase [Clostridiales bacterium]
GQFFTPVPITKFIISSLPIKEFGDKKLEKGETEVLPKTIDFACGSGHFLTEYMEQVQNIIESLDVSRANRSVRELKEISTRVKFDWAKNYVYGIDLDYRLVKTAKVSAFFNGDGEANIVWANGLANFKKTPEYTGALNYISELNNKDNGQFDIAISNPPYSVEAFKKQIDEYGKETFELYNNLTDNSKEIECLFIERTKQLLKEGGKAGIILPSSILSNGGIHSKAREILFKYFKFKAIAEMGSNTFMKTGTNTVILFLERRANGDWQRINTQIDAFFKDYRDVTVDGIENAFSKYAREVYDVDFTDYKTFIKGQVNNGIKESDLVRDYAKFESKDIVAKEQEKMLYFLLTYPQKIVLVKSGEKQVEKNFLGYEFSERRGHEGIKFYPNGTKLYDDNDKLNPQKANSYIYNAFLGKVDLDIDEELAEHLSYARMSGLIDYNANGWDKKLNLNKEVKISVRFATESIQTLVNNEILNWGSGYTFPKDLQGNTDISQVPFYKVSDMNADENTKNMTVSANYIDENTLTKQIKGKIYPKGATIFPKVGMAVKTNKKRILSKESVFDNNVMAIWSDKPQTITNEFLYEFIKQYVYLPAYSAGTNPPSLQWAKFANIKIPLPPLDVQKKIVAEIEAVEKQENETQEKQQTALSTKQSLIDNAYKTSLIPLKNVANYSDNRIDCAELSNENYVGVDNLVANLQGKISTKYLPQEGTAIAYKANNVLISNIRPYLKKIWLADNAGGASGDILVLDIFNDNMLPQFLYNCLAIDNFFNYEMQNIKGIKMPRADKTAVLNYQIPLPPLEKQKEIVAEIEKHEKAIAEAQNKLKELEQKKKDILKTYLE